MHYFYPKMKKEKEFFKNKKTIVITGIISFIGGIFFITKRVSGNIISSDYYSFNLVGIIGILLIICSAILFYYNAKNY